MSGPSIRIECINPILNVKNIQVSRDYYTNVLGFEEADWGKGSTFTFMQLEKTGVYLCEGDQGNPGTWVWIGFAGNMETFFTDLKEKGAIIREPPVNYSWALELKVEDPDGHVLRFGTDPEINEPFADR